MNPQTELTIESAKHEKQVNFLLELIDRVMFKHPQTESQFKTEIELMKKENHGNNEGATENS